MAKKSGGKSLKITLLKSTIGFNENQAKIVESCGIQNVLTKSLGSANPHNVVRATFDGLSELKDPAFIARMRGKELSELIGATA